MYLLKKKIVADKVLTRHPLRKTLTCQRPSVSTIESHCREGTFENPLAGETWEALACCLAIEHVALEVARAEHVVGRWLRRVADAGLGPRYAAVAVAEVFKIQCPSLL